MSYVKSGGLLLLSLVLASCGGNNGLRIESASHTVPVPAVVKHLKAELQKLNSRPATAIEDGVCGQSVVLKAKKATVVMSVTNEVTDETSGGPQAEFLGLEIGAKYGKNTVTADSFKTTIVFDLQPGDPAINEKVLGDSALLGAKAPIYDAIVRLENSLNENTSIEPCLSFSKGGKLEFGFSLTKTKTSDGEADFVIFALEATSNSSVKTANSIVIEYEGFGKAK